MLQPECGLAVTYFWYGMFVFRLPSLRLPGCLSAPREQSDDEGTLSLELIMHWTDEMKIEESVFDSAGAQLRNGWKMVIRVMGHSVDSGVVKQGQSSPAPVCAVQPMRLPSRSAPAVHDPSFSSLLASFPLLPFFPSIPSIA
jgi:hypothetical protein